MSVRHVGIVVRNLDKMIEFYKLLGFEELSSGEIQGKLIDDLIGIKNANINIVKMKSIKDNSVIELLKYKDIGLETRNRELFEFGITHIAVNVDNIDDMYVKLKLKGISFNTPPLLTEDNVKVCFCRDYENNWIELVEEIKSKKNYIDVVYNEESHPPSTYPDKLIDYLVDRFDIKKGSKILDAGCGNKFFLNAFKNAGMDTVGVDLNNNEDLSIFEADFEKDRLPFDDNTFDVVFSKSVLEHLKDPSNYIKEIYRTLKPNGRLIMMVPDGISCLYTYMMDYTHQKYYVKESVEDLLKIFGYREIGVEIFYQLPILWKYPVLKIVCRVLQVMFGVPKKIIKNKFIRWSKELMILSTATKK